MSLTNSPSWAYNPSTGFYNDVATQSLKIDSNSSAYASKTFSSAGNQQNWTWSGWVKRSKLGTRNQHLFGAQVDGSNIGTIFFKSDDKLKVNNKTGNSNGDECTTTAVFRDTSAWYHIVVAFDGSQATQSNRSKIYVNGVLQGRVNDLSLSTGNGYMNNNVKEHSVGARRESGTDQQFNGYVAEMNFIDGQTLDHTYFGETKNDVWIPKAYSGSYGTNGFRLEFNGNTNDSANSNNFTANSIQTHDYVSDCPENNFCTLSDLHYPVGVGNQILEGGLVADATSSSWSQIPASWAFQKGEKWYWETCASNTAYYLGVASQNVVRQSANALIGWDNPLRDAWIYHSAGLIRYNGANQASVGSISANDIIAFAVDVDGGTLRFYKNNVLQYTASHDFTGWFPDCATINTVYMGYNFGQDSTFSGIKSTGSANATDENGYGDFYYTPPSGYLAMCSANLSTAEAVDPAEDNSPTDYFDVHTYTGTEASHSIEALSFKPDWVWIKQRDTENQHNVLQDSTRGAGNHLYSNLTNNEATSQSGSISSFDAPSSSNATDGGWTMGANLQINRSGRGYVGWSWKANGGTTSSNGSGSITSTVQANQDAGFSIVSYTGNATSGATIGHGLAQAPDMIITKFRSGGSPGSGWLWPVFHKDVGTGGYLRLNGNNSTTSNSETVKAVGSSTYTIGSDGHINQSSGLFIAYVFHSVYGYSKIGSFIGNGSTDGSFIYTGFRPAFVLVKNSSVAQSWRIWDTARNPTNETNLYLTPNGDGQEGSASVSIDILSNGFKPRGTNGSMNGNGNTMIYMAFAEAPFEYANAR